MDSVRILHCADLHIGAECSTLGNRSRARKAEVKKTFSRILLLCKEEKVDLLLIAGDLFDDVRVNEETLIEIRDQIAELDATIVAIATGNHDPATPDSPYERENFWPDNTILFPSKPEGVVLEKLGVRLFGAGFTGAYCYQSLLRKCMIPEDKLINIGIMHGDLVSDSARSDYNAISIRMIEASGLDYLALGHIHKRTPIQKIGRTSYAYCGCPEGQGFDETGDKGVYLGTVSKGSCRMEYRSICRRRITEMKLDITGATDRRSFLSIIRTQMEATNGEDYREHIYRVILTGEPEQDLCRNMEELKAELDDIWYLKLQNKTRPRINPEQLVQENSLRGVFAKRMLQMSGTVSEEQRELALRLGLKAFYGEITIE